MSGGSLRLKNRKMQFRYAIFSCVFALLLFSCKKRVKLEDTVITIEEVRNIGQLISAEFQGEVISSLSIIEDSTLALPVLKRSYDSIKSFHSGLVASLAGREKLIDLNKRKTDLSFFLRNNRIEKSELTKKVVYTSTLIRKNELLLFKLDSLIDSMNWGKERKEKKQERRSLAARLKEEKRDLKKWQARLSELEKDTRKNRNDSLKVIEVYKKESEKIIKKERQEYILNEKKGVLAALQKATKKKRKKIYEEITASNDWDAFYGLNEKKIDNYLKRERKAYEDLAYLARGTVRAGYDLEKMDERGIFSSPYGDTLYVLDFNPEIFSVSVNPWFFFSEEEAQKEAEDKKLDKAELDRNLYGFQLIYSNTDNKTGLKFKDVQNLKSECKRKLKEDAVRMKILKKARESAEDVLLSLFNLMTLDPNLALRKVIISPSKYFFDQNEILFDSLIDFEESVYLRNLILQDLSEFDSVSFPQQDLAYQKFHLDRFVNELANKSSIMKNDTAWARLLAEYRDVKIQDN